MWKCSSHKHTLFHTKNPVLIVVMFKITVKIKSAFLSQEIGQRKIMHEQSSFVGTLPP